MKLTKILLCAAVAGAMTLAAGKVSAIPLELTSLTGTISATPSYSAISNTNKAHYITETIDMKKIMLIVSNQVAIDNHGTNLVPKDAKIIYDPYRSRTYLTNSLGYYQNLSGIAYFNIRDIATSFKGSVSADGAESDKIVLYVDIYGYGPDGLYYEFELRSSVGMLSYNITGGGTKVNMSITATGSGYGELKGSDEGVATGKVVLAGKGTPEFSGPFSLWWWD